MSCDARAFSSSELSTANPTAQNLDVSEPQSRLNHTQNKFLDRAIEGLLPEALQSLVVSGRSRLLEVACSPDSILTTTMHDLTKNPQSAHRCSLWNGCDLRTGVGVRAVLDSIDVNKPEHVWLSPICGPYSVMQNVNQRTDEQRADLAAKRKEALRQYVGCAIIFRYCVQRGIHVTWEWSQSCHAWRLPLINKLVGEFQPWFATIRGCRVNLRNPQGCFISKGWKIMTTHELLAQRMDLPCHCAKGTTHVPCEGSLTSRTAYYTKEFAVRACQAILQDSNKTMIHRELNQGFHGCHSFGLGTTCACDTGRLHEANVTCGHCSQPPRDEHNRPVSETPGYPQQIDGLRKPPKGNHPDGYNLGNQEQQGLVAQGSNHSFPKGMSKEWIQKKLYLLHAATGHGPIKYLIQALKRREAPAEVLTEAQRFKCSVCEERCRTQPRNQATLEPLPRRFEVISADVGHWTHPVSGEHYQFLLIVDEGSRFRVARHVLTGKKKHISAAQFISVLKESWIEYFGVPHTLRVDPDGAFRSHEIAEFSTRSGIYLDIIPGEAHWKIGTCEKSVQSTKDLLDKLAGDQEDVSFSDLLSETIRVFNSREVIRGYSPVQHVMGRAPDEYGRLFTTVTKPYSELQCEGPRDDSERSHQLRYAAEKNFLDWHNNQRLGRALNSRHRSVTNFSAGDLVYVWRRQLPHNDPQNKQGAGKFIGPARILATETSRLADGSLKKGSSVWLVRGRRLLKCAAEQLRHASEREVILDELHSTQPQAWNFPRVAEQLGGSDYNDYTEKDIPSGELERASNPTEEWQPLRRYRQKSGPPETQGSRKRSLEEDLDYEIERDAQDRPAPDTTATGSRERSRSRGSKMPSDLVAEHWTSQVETSYFVEPQEQCFWTREDAAVSVEIPMPSARAQSEKAISDLSAFVATALKRKAVEVSEKYLTDSEREQFRLAKGVEVTNFLAARAFEALPEHLRVDASRAIRMRWILTWKRKDDGTSKAKARAVLLGYQDPDYEHRSTTSPTTTRQTRQIQLQISASLGFTTEKGDVTGAFLQSRPYPTDLHCVPCKEICEAMSLPENSVVRVKKACYGLVDAPLEWYRSVSEFFLQLGFRKCWSDPCCWVLEKNQRLHGLVSGHVDDFLFSGSSQDPTWVAARAAIQKEFKWSDWESKKFTQCGVLIEENDDGSYFLSQESYVDDLKYINVRAHRRKEKGAPLDERERSQLRTLLGGLSWHAQQVAPFISAEVRLLLSEVNQATVETLSKANQLLDLARGCKTKKLKIHKIPIKDLMLCAWCDAAAQNRPDGSSTQGIVIGASTKNLLKGSCEVVSLLTWHASKISRVCRSPGASEAVAAVNAEDLLFFARFQ